MAASELDDAEVRKRAATVVDGLPTDPTKLKKGRMEIGKDGSGDATPLPYDPMKIDNKAGSRVMIKVVAK
ncbi:unnamed protein product [Linum trigynum]|uniref:Uncharacterized protein n=1 Tax=Linum trigynum TaxID=586398 RepID=A0AAV2CA89_9ROSI